MGFKGEKEELIALWSSLHCISLPISAICTGWSAGSSSELSTEVMPVVLGAAHEAVIRDQ